MTLRHPVHTRCHADVAQLSKRATNYRALLRKMTYKDTASYGDTASYEEEASYDSTPPSKAARY